MTGKNNRLVLFLGLLALLLIAPSVSATGYFADVTIDVHPDGVADIVGDSDHPLLMKSSTDSFTSKTGSTWLLNLSFEEQFSSFSFKVLLPKDVAIRYVSSTSQVAITNEGGRFAVSGSGEEELSLAIYYEFENDTKERGPASLLLFIILFLALAVGLFVYVALKSQWAKRRMRDVPSYNPSTLTDRQKQIMDVIINSRSGITQAKMERTLHLPKSSLSRNIEALTRKGFIKKERRGVANVLTINR